MPRRKSNLSTATRMARKLKQNRASESHEEREARLSSQRRRQSNYRESETQSKREERLMLDRVRHARSRQSRLMADSQHDAISREFDGRFMLLARGRANALEEILKMPDSRMKYNRLYKERNRVRVNAQRREFYQKYKEINNEKRRGKSEWNRHHIRRNKDHKFCLSTNMDEGFSYSEVQIKNEPEENEMFSTTSDDGLCIEENEYYNPFDVDVKTEMVESELASTEAQERIGDDEEIDIDFHEVYIKIERNEDDEVANTETQEENNEDEEIGVCFNEERIEQKNSEEGEEDGSREEDACGNVGDKEFEAVVTEVYLVPAEEEIGEVFVPVCRDPLEVSAFPDRATEMHSTECDKTVVSQELMGRGEECGIFRKRKLDVNRERDYRPSNPEDGTSVDVTEDLVPLDSGDLKVSGALTVNAKEIKDPTHNSDIAKKNEENGSQLTIYRNFADAIKNKERLVNLMNMHDDAIDKKQNTPIDLEDSDGSGRGKITYAFLSCNESSDLQDPETRNESFKCKLCSVEFIRREQLTVHIMKHCGLEPYRCELCGEEFITVKDLRVHEILHPVEIEYKCKVCGKVFPQYSTLKRHKSWHGGEKQYKCCVCEKRFSRSFVLKRHMLTHSGEKAFQCELCKKSFTLKEVLKRHMLTHTGQRPYACNQCPKQFTQKGHLNEHCKVHEK